MSSSRVVSVLDEMQNNLLERARAFRAEHTKQIDSWEDFVSFFTPSNPKRADIHGGFAMAHWCGETGSEEKLKDLKVTIRCVPLDAPDEPGSCVITGKPSKRRVLFAKAY